MKKFLPLVLLLLLAVVAGLKLKSNKKAAADKLYQADQTAPVAVGTYTMQTGSLADEKQFTGSFEANRESKISAEIQGGIREMRVEVGSVVQAGQLLVQLDQVLLQHQREAVRLQIKNAQADLDRYAVLAQADAIQAVQYEKALLALQSLQVQQASLEAQLLKTSIKAPFSGVVTAKFAEIGGFAAPGQPLLELAELSTLQFTVLVPEIDLNRFQQPSSWRITADAYPELSLVPQQMRNNSKANAANLYSLRFMVKNSPDQRLKAGMFGKLRLKSQADSTVLVPATALVGSANQPQLYVVQNGKAHLQPVKTGRSHAQQVEILEGLQAGDVIVATGLVNVFEGATIQPQP